MGARITSGMREEGILSKTEAERLLAFTNNSGPLFIIGAVAVGMFKQYNTGLLFLACHIAACITVGILFRFYRKNDRIPENAYGRNLSVRFKRELLRKPEGQSGWGGVFGDAVKNSVMVLLSIGGFIVFFSVVINILLETGFISGFANFLGVILAPLGVERNVISAVIGGFFEITTGCSMASKALNAPYVQQLVATSMVLGWAGLSVHAQVISIVSRTDISIKPYLLGKCLQGLIAGVYTFICIRLWGTSILTSVSLNHPQIDTVGQLRWINYFTGSCRGFVISLGIILAGIITAAVLGIIKGMRIRAGNPYR